MRSFYFNLPVSVSHMPVQTVWSTYQANRAYLIGRLKKKLPGLLLKPGGIRRQLLGLLYEAVRKRSQIQPGRNCKRHGSSSGTGT